MEVDKQHQKVCIPSKYTGLLIVLLCVSVILNVIGTLIYLKWKQIQDSFSINIAMKADEMIDNSYDIVNSDEINSNYTNDLDFVKTCAGLIQVFSNNIKEKTTFIVPNGFNIIERVTYSNNKSSDFGLIMIDKNQRLWIIFRGTQTYNDILNDIQYSQVPYKGNNNVHKGFYKLFKSLSEQIFKTIDLCNPTQIIITGHSLGAAIATLTAIEVHAQYPHIQLKGVGFASPRVGDRGFVKSFNNIDSIEWTSIINIEDIVPQLPRAIINTSSGVEMYQHVGKIRIFSTNNGSILLNHLIPTYRASLYDISKR